ncbi:MAG: excinuclease ABC subunit UvrC [Candidatus Sericytochromatia bacterium]|nr:excinuclease ABC subunit UvrC [Candidatus Sericytochromatia bacterium]
MHETLPESLAQLPTLPGVYLYYGADGQILYVGKAINLRSRVRSYFQNGAKTPKTAMLVSHIVRMETIVTDTEVEALILEATLIKQHLPHYNILLKDDKQYPYLKVTLNEAFPRLLIVRRRQQDNARYYGPFTDTGALYELMELLETLFPLRKKHRPPNVDRPCLNYHIGRCLGPCQNLVDKTTYRLMVDDLCSVLNGRTAELEKRLKQQMQAAAEALHFEYAGRLRDQLAALDKLLQRQKVVADPDTDQDVIGLARCPEGVSVQVFQVRLGKLIGRYGFSYPSDNGVATEVPLPELIGAFLQEYYVQCPYVPSQIVLPDHPTDEAILVPWLSGKRGKAVQLLVPQRGAKAEILGMATRNAQLGLDRLKLQALSRSRSAGDSLLAELAAALQLPRLPRHIEGFDISTLHGNQTVASMVCFKDGVASKADYRKFKIRAIRPGMESNDFASMNEAVRRRYTRLLAEKKPLPDLILIDGGKGQLGEAIRVLRELGLGDLPVFGLAKQREELFRPGESQPIVLPHSSQALQLLQRVRDEAHRFAVSFHRQLRGKRFVSSELDRVAGIGPARKKQLLNRFESVEGLRHASLEDLILLGQLPKPVAEGLYRAMHADERADS